jgi:group I intron endonuclease
MNSGIYVWKLDGVPKYVGQGMDVEKRMLADHRRCTALFNAIKKYGVDAFEKEVVEYCPIENLNQLEEFYIKEFHTHISEKVGYNISWGGEYGYGLRGRKVSEETRKKLSKALKGRTSPLKGRRVPEEIRRKVAAAHPAGENHPFFGKPVSEERKRNISKALTGLFAGRNHPNLGRKLSEETKQKISELGRGINHSQFGTKRKGSISNYFGVTQKKIREYLCWYAQITIDKRQHYIGNFRTEVLAAKAYDKYVVENNLPNPLNFPNSYIAKNKYQFMLLQNIINRRATD